MPYRLGIVAFIALELTVGALRAEPADSLSIVCDKGAAFAERLAGKEVRRYIYLRTGKLLPILDNLQETTGGSLIVVGRKGRPAVQSLLSDPKLKATIDGLAPAQYAIETVQYNGRPTWLVAGGDAVGTLYGAYRFAERLGVRFYLHGDVVPDRPVALALPTINEVRKPLFNLRGIQPFHDFPEGPDWWNADDYKAYSAQLVKMKMNFIGLHTYPYFAGWSWVGQEPAVWIGQSNEFDQQGHVRQSYPTAWFNTKRPMWGYKPTDTSSYRFGAAELEAETYGADVMRGLCPQPKTPEQCNEMFNRVGDMFRDVFAFARPLGIKSCVGTETPLWIPDELRTRLKAAGKDPDAVATVCAVYEGVFRRIMAAYPVDYYWFWTPERDIDPAKTQVDLEAAVAAHRNVAPPFGLALCGWGWVARNFDRFHKAMPTEMAFSCINDGGGFVPVTPGFAALGKRPHWAIPWLEDDFCIAIPQLWVGRMRKDAADALKYRCSGLMGIHWRTRVLGMNAAALAQAGWSHENWTGTPSSHRDLGSADFYLDWCRSEFGPEAGEAAAAIFNPLDGRMPRRHCRWNACGPGAVGDPDPRPWAEVAKEYAFVDALAALDGRISGPGNRERFDYWLDTFRYMRAMAKVCCTMAEQDRRMAELSAADSVKKPAALKAALAARRHLLADWTEMVTFLLQTVSTPGELGTVANLEQHSRIAIGMLNRHDAALEKAMGAKLPADLAPSAAYAGRDRVIVPTVRSLLTKGEALTLTIMVMSAQPVNSVAVRIRPLGGSAWQTIPARHVGRAVFRATLPGAQDDFEYMVVAQCAAGKTLTWPATAPETNQTVVVTERLAPASGPRR